MQAETAGLHGELAVLDWLLRQPSPEVNIEVAYEGTIQTLIERGHIGAGTETFGAVTKTILWVTESGHEHRKRLLARLSWRNRLRYWFSPQSLPSFALGFLIASLIWFLALWAGESSASEGLQRIGWESLFRR